MSRLFRALVASAALLAAPATAQASTVFDGGFETGNVSQYSLNQMCKPDRAQVYSAQSQPGWPAPSQGRYAVRFGVQSTDVSPCTPTGNPRAQLATGKIMRQGSEYWESYDVNFPASFPDLKPGGFFLFQEDYSEPWNGSPALGMDTEDVGGVDKLTIHRGAQYGYDRIWSANLVRGQWTRFLVHKKLAKDSTGFIELWINGVKQTFKNGSQKFFTQTMHSDQSGDTRFFINSYRRAGAYPGTVSTYYDNIRIGTTRADVDPTPGGAPAPAPAPAVRAAYTYAPNAPVAGTPVQFDATGSGPAVAFDWSLDGITKLSGAKPSFTFKTAGTKNVSLTVTDSKGVRTSLTKAVVVR
jgi:hypothetical protein